MFLKHCQFGHLWAVANAFGLPLRIFQRMCVNILSPPIVFPAIRQIDSNQQRRALEHEAV